MVPPYLGENYESHWGIFSFEGRTILDIGADYGSTASFFLEKGAKRVIAVESDTDLFRQLVSNYGHDSDVATVQLAVAEGRDLIRLIETYNPDVLKMDCEGCEIFLTDLDDATLGRVPEYLIETHDHTLKVGTARGIEELFERVGYVHETYEVLPGVQVVHAKRAWNALTLSETDIIRMKNRILLQAEKGVSIGILRNHYGKLEEDFARTRSEKDALNQELARVCSEKDSTAGKLRHAGYELQVIKNSFGYKFLRFYASRIDRLLPDGTRRGEFRKVVVSSARILATEGIMSFVRQALDKLKRREFRITTTPTSPEAAEPGFEYEFPEIRDIQEEQEAKEEPVKGRTSVIITAKSPSTELGQALERLRNQEGIESSEIIVVSTADRDMTSLAETYGAKVSDIASEKVDDVPSTKRAVQGAAGDYVCFLAEDAIPASKHFLRDLVRALETDTTVAVATTRRIPRTDADLMTCATANNYHEDPDISSNRTMSLQDVASLTAEERRRLYRAFNVCSCFRRDVLRTFDHAPRNAELAFGLMRDGWKSVQVFSTAIIYSHNMNPFECLRYWYAETKILGDLLDNGQGQPDFCKFESLDHLLDCAADLCATVRSAINLLVDTNLYDRDISETFRAIERTLTKSYESVDTSANHELSKALSDMSEVVHHVQGNRPKSNPMRYAFAHSIRTLEEYISRTHKDLTDMEAEFVEALYQLTGTVVGTCMAQHNMGSRRDERATRLHEFLSRDLQ